jgi:site-specific DNA-methyltransferase (adenine-specific)/modification methylase
VQETLKEATKQDETDSVCGQVERFVGHRPSYYEDDFVTIYHADNRELLPYIGNFDCVITSPPYNMRTRIRNGKYTESEWSEHFSKKYSHYSDALTIQEYYEFQNEVIFKCLQISPIMFINIQIVTGSKEAWFKLIGEYRKQIKDIAIWDKGHGQPAIHDSVMNRTYEIILILESNADAGRAFKKSYFGRGTMPDIWRINKRSNGKIKEHRASFPIDLPYKIISNWTKIGDSILDPHGGTGTTARAAKDLGRKCTIIELEEKYCEIAANKCRQECLPLGG